VLLLIGGIVFGGVITFAACTNVFPTSLSSFGSGGCISSLWGNALETKIGINNSTDPTSLDWKSRNLDLTNNASGTLATGKGGTATTTFLQGLVMASGTQAFSSLQTNGNGSIPIASGTTWIANTLTAGNNVTITTSTGGISISSVATAYSYQNHNLITTLGTTTWSAPISSVYITMVGGGGGGGDSKSATGNYGAGGGSGAWSYKHLITGLTLGNSYNVFVGSGGIASVGSGDGNGGYASSSNFNNLIVCGGGSGGGANGGSGGVAGIQGVGCDFSGANGGNGANGGPKGGGGAGSGPITLNESLGNWVAVTSFCVSTSSVNSATSTGASSATGLAGFGEFGCGGQGPSATAVGTPGGGYGSGGSGGAGSNSAGAAGKQGFVLIEW
jgi:hypothetical protein